MKHLTALLLAVLLLILPVLACAESVSTEASAQQETPAQENAPVRKEKNAPLKLLKELYTQQNMLVFSPVSLSVALSMAAEGADGETLSQLDAFLGRKPDTMFIEDMRFSGVQLADIALVRPGFELLGTYEQALSRKYDASVASMDPESVMMQVNDWVSDHTQGLIEELLTEEPDPNTMLLLINALSMKADWVHPFPAAATGFGLFHAPQGDIEVSSMHQTASLSYSCVDGVQTVSLPYRNSPLEMLVLLPEDGNLDALIEALCASPDEFIARHEPQEEKMVRLSLPNVYAESSFELKDALMAMGVINAFDPDLADFSAMAANAPEYDLYIGSVLQKAVLHVNETGTEAAAATQVAVLTRGAFAPQEIIEMNVDRPFMMLVYDRFSGYVLFAACINNPA